MNWRGCVYAETSFWTQHKDNSGGKVSYNLAHSLTWPNSPFFLWVGKEEEMQINTVSCSNVLDVDCYIGKK